MSSHGWIERQAWTLQRFGITPRKLVRRLGSSGGPPVLLVSVPKSGTHLLERALCLHPDLYRRLTRTLLREQVDQRWHGLDGLTTRLRPGQVVVSHLEFREGDPEVLSRSGVRSLFMVRDPRDVVLSIVLYAVGRKDFPPGEAYRSLPDVRSRIRLAIDGRPESLIPSMRDRLASYRGWLCSDALVVRFEELVGAAGGGNRDAQRRTLGAIYEHVGASATPALVDDVAARVFSSVSPTFRRGAIGGWRAAFDRELLEHFEVAAGDLAAEYGYPLGA